jgi:hypothetical protein
MILTHLVFFRFLRGASEVGGAPPVVTPGLIRMQNESLTVASADDEKFRGSL